MIYLSTYRHSITQARDLANMYDFQPGNWPEHPNLMKLLAKSSTSILIKLSNPRSKRISHTSIEVYKGTIGEDGLMANPMVKESITSVKMERRYFTRGRLIQNPTVKATLSIMKVSGNMKVISEKDKQAGREK